jgi:hypothetical protein
MNTMTTLSEITNLLKARGYTIDFDVKENHLECDGDLLKIYPGEFVIDKQYRFEGPSDPGDEAIVYAISSQKYNVKGVLINGYGVSSNSITDEMIKVLSVNKPAC